MKFKRFILLLSITCSINAYAYDESKIHCEAIGLALSQIYSQSAKVWKTERNYGEEKVALLNVKFFNTVSQKYSLLATSDQNYRKDDYFEIVAKRTADYGQNYFDASNKNDSVALKKLNSHSWDFSRCSSNVGHSWELFQKNPSTYKF